MDLKEIQNLIKFVANSGVAEVKLEMDDVKITIRTTLETNVTEATYVQQLPAQQALPRQIRYRPCEAPHPTTLKVGRVSGAPRSCAAVLRA